jgi:hypothetical protein
LLCYSANGLKVILLSVGLALFLYFVVRKRARWTGHLLVAIFAFLLLMYLGASTVSDRSNGMVQSMETVVMRSVVTPGVLTAQYHDFFQNHPAVWLADTKPFKWFMHSPLDQEVMFAVTQRYSGSNVASSNAHFWAQEGIANFGLPGILLVSVLVGLALRGVDRICVDRDPCFAAIAFMFAGLNLSNAPLATTVLSGGLGLTALLVAMVPADRHRISAAPRAAKGPLGLRRFGMQGQGTPRGVLSAEKAVLSTSGTPQGIPGRRSV